MSSADQVLIVGASTRAAAFSAVRAGLKPRCIDYFADRDLAALCLVDRVAIEQGAAGLERAALALETQSLFYTGPIENHPELVERLAQRHHLCGNAAGTLRSVRDPRRVMEALRRHGLPAPDVRTSFDGLPRDSTWLIKPLASGGGRSIRFLDQLPFSPGEPVHFQKWIDGPSFSALYVASGGRAELLGVTRQLVGVPGSLFAYHGSIGPFPVSAWHSEALGELGDCLASSFDLVGLFGVDYILRDEEPWTVEVNPRYTASVEVLELALARSLVAEHLRACLAQPPVKSSTTAHQSTSKVVGKAIIFASRPFVVPEVPFDDPRRRDPFAVPAIADVPWPAQAWAGDPLMTVFATGADVETCARRLAKIEEHWRRKLKA
ncbi:MAG: ATP-grasp domain-containing protein [Isosphaeraceae bacterium]